MMKTIKQFPYLAIAFGVLALVTGVVLVISTPPWLNWILAVFWFGTGLLGIYSGFRK